MIVISTGEVNRGGWRLLPEGGNADAFKKNPIFLFQHTRSASWDRDRLPIGRIENLRLENGQWVADDPIFDEDDEFAMKLKTKYDKGMLNAFSPGILPLETSTDLSMLLPGQTRATVTKWEFMEISLVDIPKDKNATRLHLSADQSENDIIPALQKSASMNTENIALALGIDAKANQDEILAAIKSQKENIVNLTIDLGKAKGVINEKNEENYRSLASSNFEATRGLILSDTGNKTEETQITEEADTMTMAGFLKEVQKLNLKNNSKDDSQDDRSNWGFLQWSKKDPAGLQKLQKENPEKYEALAAAYTGA